jgi:hypothetical protein
LDPSEAVCWKALEPSQAPEEPLPPPNPLPSTLRPLEFEHVAFARNLRQSGARCGGHVGPVSLSVRLHLCPKLLTCLQPLDNPSAGAVWASLPSSAVDECLWSSRPSAFRAAASPTPPVDSRRIVIAHDSGKSPALRRGCLTVQCAYVLARRLHCPKDVRSVRSLDATSRMLNPSCCLSNNTDGRTLTSGSQLFSNLSSHDVGQPSPPTATQTPASSATPAPVSARKPTR